MKKKKPLKKTVSLSLDTDVIEKIKEYAEDSDRSFSSYINLLLRRHINAKENKEKNDSDKE